MKKGKKQFYFIGGILIVLLVMLSGCARKTTSGKSKSESLPKIVIGCDDYTPFNYMDMNGKITGIDVELAREAFDRMGYQAEFQFIDWEEKKQLLKDGSIDCVWSSFTMDGREEEYKWAGPYMKSNQVIAVNVDSDISEIKDLKGKTIAVQSTTKPEDLFRSHGEEIPDFRKIISVKNRDVLFILLNKGYVDAIAAHDTSVIQFMKDFDMEYRILEKPLLTVNLGVAFDRDDDRGLDEKLSETLQQMQSDGTIKKIISKYLPNAEKYLEDAYDE